MRNTPANFKGSVWVLCLSIVTIKVLSGVLLYHKEFVKTLAGLFSFSFALRQKRIRGGGGGVLSTPSSPGRNRVKPYFDYLDALEALVPLGYFVGGKGPLI